MWNSGTILFCHKPHYFFSVCQDSKLSVGSVKLEFVHSSWIFSTTFWTANQLKSGCGMEYGEQGEGGPCYWHAWGHGDQKTFLMGSQVTEWMGAHVAKKPSEGAGPQHPVSPCSWIKSQQRKDNEIQEKTEMLNCWKIICSEPNPAFQNTLTEPEFTLVHNSISQGLYLCFKAQPQNWCWNGSESPVSGQMMAVAWSVPTGSAKIGKFKALLMFEHFGCYTQTHKQRRES